MARRTLLIITAAVAVGCSGRQVTEPETEGTTEQREERREERREETGPSPEELAALRLAEADAAFLRAATLFDDEGAGSAREVEELLTEAMEKNPEYAAEAWYDIGLARYAAGDESGAIEAYRAAGQADAQFARGLANIGYMQMLDGDYAGATATFNECIARLETEPGCNINLAVMYAMGQAPYEGDLRSAMITRYRFALGGDAHNAEAYANLSQIYYEQEQYELARMTCESAILLGIEEAILHNRLGLIALKQDDVIGAYAEFQRAVALDENFMEAWTNIGAMALSFRDYDAALAAFERVLAASPDDILIRLSYGAALRGVDMNAEAQAEYEAVLAARPGHPGALYNMGLLYQEAYQDYPQACGYYLEYLERGSPSDHEYGDAERRLTSLHSLLESLAFIGQAAQEDVDACSR